MPNIGELSVGVKVEKSSLTTMTNEIKKEAQQAGASIEDLGKKTTATMNESSKSAKTFGDSLTGLKGIIATVFWVTAIYNFGKSIASLANNLEQNRVAFTTMLGSAKEAQILLTNLSDFAKKTPFELTGIRDTAKQLLAFGISSNDMIPTLKMLGDVAAGVGKPIEQIALVYGQVKTANRLMGQDLMQFTAAGVPLIAQLAKQFKVSESAIKDMVEKGKVGFADVQKALVAMTSEGGKFANMMDAQSKTLGGVWSNLVDSVTQVGEKIGTALIPVMKTTIWLLQDLTKFFTSAAGKAVAVAIAAGVATLAFWLLIPVVGGLAVSFTAAAVSGGVLAGVLAVIGGPITLITLGIAALAGAGFYAYESFNGLTGITGDLQAQLNDLKSQQDENQKAFEDGTITQEEYRKKTEDNTAAQNQLKGAIDEVKNGTITYWTIKERINNLKKIADVDAYNRETSAITAQIAKLRELMAVKAADARVKLSQYESDKAREKDNPIYGEWSLAPTISLEVVQRADSEYLKAKSDVEALEKAIKEADTAHQDAMNKLKDPPGWGGGGGGSKTGGAKKEAQELTYEVGKLKDGYEALKKSKTSLENLDKQYNEANKKRMAETKKALNEISDKLKDNEKAFAEAIKSAEESANAKAKDTTSSYAQQQVEKQVEYEKQLKDLQQEEKEQLAISNTDQNKLLDTMKQRAEVERKLADVKSNIANLSAKDVEGMTALLDIERKRAGMTDEKRQEFDYQEQLKKIAEDKAKAEADATKSYRENYNQLQRQKEIYEFFQKQTSFTPGQLSKLEQSDQFKSASGDEQNLMIKLATELIALTQQKNKKIALEQEVATATEKLSDLTTQKALANVGKLKKEYQDLIAQINAAIEAQRALESRNNASTSSTGFAEGGYTGDGGKHDVAGIVHKGEYVLSQNMISKMPGIVPALEWVRSGNTIDNSKKVEISGPISMSEALDFELLLRRAKFIM